MGEIGWGGAWVRERDALDCRWIWEAEGLGKGILGRKAGWKREMGWGEKGLGR